MGPAHEPRPPTPDAACCLLFAGDGLHSSGVYRPHGYELHLRGSDTAEHQITHLHEIHHAALNDDSAWGAMIHIAARHAPWADETLAFLTRHCRLPHEAFASFLSISLSLHHIPDGERVLAAYPVYLPLYRRMRRLLHPVPPGHRQDIAATAIARFCMSAPVLEVALEHHRAPRPLAGIPSDWLPDQRLALISTAGRDVVQAACWHADEVFQAELGQGVDDVGLDGDQADLDAVWDLWERAFITTLLTRHSRLTHTPAMSTSEHRTVAAELASVLSAQGANVELPHELGTPRSDAHTVQRLLPTATVVLREAPLPSLLTLVGEDPVTDALIQHAATPPASPLVVQGRMPRHLASLFQFGPADHERLLSTSAAEPIFAIRLPVADGDDQVVVNARLDTPQGFCAVSELWADHVRANCIALSCYANRDWQYAWLPVLRRLPTVVLVDHGLLGAVGPGRPLGDSQEVHAAFLHTERDAIRGLVWHVEGHPHVMLALGDDLIVQLITGQLRELLGSRLVLSDSDWSAWGDVLGAVVSSVLGTEPRLSFEGDS